MSAALACAHVSFSSSPLMSLSSFISHLSSLSLLSLSHLISHLSLISSSHPLLLSSHLSSLSFSLLSSLSSLFISSSHHISHLSLHLIISHQQREQPLIFQGFKIPQQNCVTDTEKWIEKEMGCAGRGKVTVHKVRLSKKKGTKTKSDVAGTLQKLSKLNINIVIKIQGLKIEKFKIQN